MNVEEVSEKNKKYYKENKDKILSYHKEYYVKNRDAILEYQRKYEAKHRKRNNKKRRIYREKNREKILKGQKKFREENKDKIRGEQRRYREENKDKLRNRKRNDYLKNIDEYRKMHREYYANHKNQKYKYDKNYRKTEKGKELHAISQSKRKGYGHIILMHDVFPIPSQGHHLKNKLGDIDSKKDFIWFLPAKTHEYVHGSSSDERHWTFCGEWIKKLFCMSINKFLTGEDDFMCYNAWDRRGEKLMEMIERYNNQDGGENIDVFKK